MKIGKLIFNPITDHFDLVANPIQKFLQKTNVSDKVYAAKIDPEFADTESFCKNYDVDIAIATNCLVLEAKRADRVWYAACFLLADDSADINGVIRKTLNARKVSFAPMEKALELTGMEYGGITPIGLPDDWVVLVDQNILNKKFVVVGGGVRGSKMAIETSIFKELQNTQILSITK